MFDGKLPGIIQNIYSDDWKDLSQVYIEKLGVLKVSSLPSVKERASVRDQLQIVVSVTAVYL